MFWRKIYFESLVDLGLGKLILIFVLNFGLNIKYVNKLMLLYLDMWVLWLLFIWCMLLLLMIFLDLKII